MHYANFVAIPSVDAVLPKQQPSFWGVLYWAQLMLEYWHVSQSTKKMMKAIER